MIVIYSIFEYLVLSITDIMDKFLITTRKIEPVSYTFYTVVMGLLLLLAWPMVYQPLPMHNIALNLFSGAYFSFTMYLFFKTLSFGEVTRVIPFVYGIVPIFDILITWITGRNPLTISEVSALALLVPGAILISYRPGKHSHKHVLMKIITAFFISSYGFIWQYGAQVGSSLNNLMWNRIGAAAVLLLLLLLPKFRKKIFVVQHVPKKGNTTFLFLVKQALGGVSFVFLSHLYTIGKISVINALSGFRYVFLFIFGLIFSGKKYKHILGEEIDHKIIKQKAFAIVLISLGTLILFIF